MVNWESQSKTPPRVRKTDSFIVFLLIRIAFCHVSENSPLRCLFYDTMNIYFYFNVNTARDVVPVLLIFANYLSLYLHIFTCTYRGTHTQAHMYNQHTKGMETTRHRSLVERGGRKALLETLRTHTHTHTQKCQKKPDIHEAKIRIGAHGASSKDTRLFLTK